MKTHKQLIMLMGLPGSGKSTWAREQAGFVRVNKDDIRTALKQKGWVWSRENEKDVIQERDRQIEFALLEGHSVISDDCNFGRKHEVRLDQLARAGEADFSIRRFDTPLQTCLDRNASREGNARIPEEAIRQMFNQFIAPDYDHWPLSAPKPDMKVEPVVPDESLMPAIICDLDGTLSLFEKKGHRGPYDAGKADEDDCNLHVRRVLEVFYRFMNYQIIYVSGREDQFRPQTETFFMKNHIPPGPLYMRGTGDTRKDATVKRELFDAHIRGKYNVDFVLDDRNQVVEMWRGLGLQCWQVAKGDF